MELYLIAPRREETEEAKVFSRTMDDQLQASPYTSRAHLLGKQTNVNEFMRAADIFVFPSRQEGLPDVILEALTSGLPIVMTPFVGLPEELGRMVERMNWCRSMQMPSPTRACAAQ